MTRMGSAFLPEFHEGSLTVQAHTLPGTSLAKSDEIGRRVELTSGAITTAVDRLESRGLVTREAHESDRRARIVRLTARGKEHATKVFASHKTAMDFVATGLSRTERATLIELLRKLGTSAELPQRQNNGRRRGAET